MQEEELVQLVVQRRLETTYPAGHELPQVVKLEPCTRLHWERLSGCEMQEDELVQLVEQLRLDM